MDFNTVKLLTTRIEILKIPLVKNLTMKNFKLTYFYFNCLVFPKGASTGHWKMLSNATFHDQVHLRNWTYREHRFLTAKGLRLNHVLMCIVILQVTNTVHSSSSNWHLTFFFFREKHGGLVFKQYILGNFMTIFRNLTLRKKSVTVLNCSWCTHILKCLAYTLRLCISVGDSMVANIFKIQFIHITFWLN